MRGERHVNVSGVPTTSVMKKILVISHNFPGTGGRNFKMIKYLPKFGYSPTVITNKVPGDHVAERIVAEELNGNCPIHRTVCLNKSPFRVFSRFFNSWSTSAYFDRLFFIPDIYITWVPSAFLTALRIIRKERIDVVMTVSPPESVHITGLLLHRTTGVKWVTSFEDLWTTKKITYRPPTPLHDLICRRIEGVIYEETAHIIANTERNREIYINDFHTPEKKITVVTLGYDETEVSGLPPLQEGGRNKCVIGYMGFFDKGGFPWKEFLLALKRLSSELRDKTIALNVYGHASRDAIDFVRNENLGDAVIFHGSFPHKEAVRKVAESDLLLLLLYETDYSRAIIPHKLYHYFGMERPILAIAGEDGEVARLIRRTRTGVVISPRKTEKIYGVLRSFFEAWESGRIPFDGDRNEIRKYEITGLTEKLSRTLDDVIEAQSIDRRA